MSRSWMGDYAGGELESYEQEEADGVQQEDRRSSKEKRQQEKERKKYKFLSAHCENLTQKAKDGKIDHIVGRDKEIERVIQILNRRTKNNPCLIGEPGVGKTAIAEGIGAETGRGKCSGYVAGQGAVPAGYDLAGSGDPVPRAV